MDANELRDELAAALLKLKAGEMKPEAAAAMSALAGQMISSAKTQVAYYAFRGQKPVISFLEARSTTRTHRIAGDDKQPRSTSEVSA
jgi:hypothetical protein